jgi:hypothetical protein
MVGNDSKKGYGDSQEEIMKGEFSDQFVYLWNFGKMAKYGIGKLLIACVAIRSYI